MHNLLPFLDRDRERARLESFSRRPQGGLAVLYGRRRCGKSRLLLESLPAERLVYYLADEREPALQRGSLAAECARARPGFDGPLYPDWEALLAAWWEHAPAGSVLAIDEFPVLVSGSRELPSVLQRHLDRGGRHVALCGSSQRMMQGLALDRTAPLYGRAREILKVGPLPAGWIQAGLGLSDAVAAVEAYSIWGGVPRYWELAVEGGPLWEAVESLVLDPLGVLHEEPASLLQEDIRDPAQSSSILQLVGSGCQRLSEIAGRLEKPATSLTRPLQRLLELGLLERQKPFGAELRDSKRSLYRLVDPFLRFWFRYVGPNRSRLQRRVSVIRQIQADFAHHVGGVWEDLARASLPALNLHGREWGEASRYWDAGLEIDLVAESVDRKAVLLGSVKWEEKSDPGRVLQQLKSQAARFPLAAGRPLCLALWLKRKAQLEEVPVVDPGTVLSALN